MRVEHSATIDQPVDRVFEYVSTPENDPTWVPASLRATRALMWAIQRPLYGTGAMHNASELLRKPNANFAFTEFSEVQQESSKN